MVVTARVVAHSHRRRRRHHGRRARRHHRHPHSHRHRLRHQSQAQAQLQGSALAHKRRSQTALLAPVSRVASRQAATTNACRMGEGSVWRRARVEMAYARCLQVHRAKAAALPSSAPRCALRLRPHQRTRIASVRTNSSPHVSIARLRSAAQRPGGTTSAARTEASAMGVASAPKASASRFMGPSAPVGVLAPLRLRSAATMVALAASSSCHTRPHHHATRHLIHPRHRSRHHRHYHRRLLGHRARRTHRRQHPRCRHPRPRFLPLRARVPRCASPFAAKGATRVPARVRSLSATCLVAMGSARPTGNALAIGATRIRTVPRRSC